jgi:hypothetical protein
MEATRFLLYPTPAIGTLVIDTLVIGTLAPPVGRVEPDNVAAQRGQVGSVCVCVCVCVCV